MQLLLRATDLFPLDLDTGDRPLNGPVDGHKFLVLVFDKLVDQSASVARWNVFHDTLHVVLGFLEFFNVALKVLSIDVLLLSFDVFPAFIALLSFEVEQSELGVVSGVTIL